jgi:hypothetical protein
MEKIYEFSDLEKGLATFRVMESKLKSLNLLTPSPSFWYDLNISTNDKGHIVVFLNSGGIKNFNLIEDDIEMS